jgi:adenine-specific DNA-methyltransferase
MRLTIKARYKSSTAQVWKADALEMLQRLKPGSISLIVSSPPYFMGKEYDRSQSASDFLAQHNRLFPLLAKLLKPGGSICWQVGYHVQNNRIVPLDALVYSVTSHIPELVLRNRIVWTFNHGAHCSQRLSGRHETIMWYTKGERYAFNLDAVRVPQRYPGKRHYKGPNRGYWSGNPLGKNPGDVWDIPNVKARHVEKTPHSCQFPAALVRRLVLALTKSGDTVLDPFLGSGTTCVVALSEHRNFVGCDVDSKYLRITRKRIDDLIGGRLALRPDMPVRLPQLSEAVARRPSHFAAPSYLASGSTLTFPSLF